MSIQEKKPHFPAKYKVGEIDYSREIIIWIIAAGVVISTFGIMIGTLGIFLLTIDSGVKPVSIEYSSLEFILLVIIILIIYILHEGIHGLVSRIYGKEVKFGIKILYKIAPVFYTYSEGLFSRNQVIIVILAPSLLITTASSLILMITLNLKLPMFSIFILAVILVHLSGCGGDFYLAYRLLKYPSTVIIENTGVDDPFIIWNDSELKSLNDSIIPQTWIIHRYLKPVTKYGRRLASISCLFFILVILGGTVLGILLPVIMITLMTKELQLMGFRYIKTSNGIEISLVNPWELLIISFLGTIVVSFSYRKIIKYRRKALLEKKKTDSTK